MVSKCSTVTRKPIILNENSCINLFHNTNQNHCSRHNQINSKVHMIMEPFSSENLNEQQTISTDKGLTILYLAII